MQENVIVKQQKAERFPIHQTVKDAYHFLSLEGCHVLRLAVVPFLLSFLPILFQAMTNYFPDAAAVLGGFMDANESVSKGELIKHASFLGGVQLWDFLWRTAFSIALIRFILGATTVSSLLSFGKREVRYILYGLLIILIALAVGAVAVSGFIFLEHEAFKVIAALFLVIVLVWVVMFVFKTMFVYVDIALDQPVSLKRSWENTKGVVWGVIAATFLSILGPQIVLQGIMQVVKPHPYIMQAVELVMTYVTVVFSMYVLCAAYHWKGLPGAVKR